MNTQPLTSKLTVLLIEDHSGDARLIREHLNDPAGRAAFTLEHVATLGEGLARLAQGGVDLVLLDLSLPDSPVPETFQRVLKAAPQVAIIVMSGLDDEQFAMQTVQEGAQDYLVKQHVEARLLLHAMRYAVERKRVAEALAQERELFHALLDNLPDRIYFKNARSEFTRISKAVAEQFKLAHPREAVGQTDRAFFSAEHAEAAFRDEQEVMDSGVPLIRKVEKETLPNGSVTWALTSKLPLRNRHGQVIGNFGISRDITPLKEAEEMLERERNLLRHLVNNLPDVIYVKDVQGRYLLDNVAHRRLLGKDSEQEIHGRTVHAFFPPELADRYAADDQRVLTSGQPLVNHEEPIVDSFGSRRWLATTKVALHNKAQVIFGLVCISRDITEKKLSEEALRTANEELARNRDALQKTLGDLQHSHEELKLAQGQLIEAEKLQSIGRLAAGVAHEVKNPLGILRMGVDYFAKNLRADDENASLILADMVESIKRADDIILGLLDFSAPHALDSHAEDLSALIEESLALVRHEFAGGRIQLQKQLARDLPALWLDRNKIKQVFVNVLANALHAMPDGGLLTVRTAARLLKEDETTFDAGSRLPDRFRTGDKVVFADVLDTGHGIPEDKLAHIFDPFFTTKAAGTGTGLGLTVTKKIVELHNGTLEIRNRKEGGVAARICFKV